MRFFQEGHRPRVGRDDLRRKEIRGGTWVVLGGGGRDERKSPEGAVYDGVHFVVRTG